MSDGLRRALCQLWRDAKANWCDYEDGESTSGDEMTVVIAAARRTREILFGLFAVGAVTATAIAQDNLSLGKRIWSDKARCSYCHGWAGDGAGDPFSNIGPSLRETALDPTQFREVVQCGRPGTKMPYHDRFAYTDDRCYGVTRADLGDQMPSRANSPLSAREIDAVVAYWEAQVRGREAATKAECEEFFGPGSPSCASYQ